MWALDTDVLSLWSRKDAATTDRVREYDPAELAVTIITIDEILGGWYAAIRQARNDRQVVRAYRSFEEAVAVFRPLRILGFTESALARFHALRSAFRRLGTNDLRIAAICLENDATLVTRNVRDFRQVPGLRIEDSSR